MSIAPISLPGDHDLAPGFFVAVARLAMGGWGIPPVSDLGERCLRRGVGEEQRCEEPRAV